MKLSDALQLVNIVIGMDGDKEKIISDLVAVAARNNNMRIDVVTRAVLSREARKPSGFQDGIAIPHSFSRDCEKVGASLAVLKEPVDWKTPNHPPVRLVLLIVGSHRHINSYIQMVACGAKVLSSKAFREGAVKANTVEELLNLVKEIEKKFNYA